MDFDDFLDKITGNPDVPVKTYVKTYKPDEIIWIMDYRDELLAYWSNEYMSKPVGVRRPKEIKYKDFDEFNMTILSSADVNKYNEAIKVVEKRREKNKEIKDKTS